MMNSAPSQDSTSRARIELLDRVHFALLRVVGIECSLREVAASKYVQPQPLWPPLVDEELLALSDDQRDILGEYLESVESEGKVRYDRVDSKLRTLLGVNGLAFALVAGFSLSGKPIFLVASAPFIASAVLALRALGVSTFQVASLTVDELRLEPSRLRSTRGQNRIAAANENACVVDFIVDCFKAAHRYFILALIMLPALYLVGLSFSDKEVSPVGVHIAAIDASVARSLRGAPGAQGIPGTPGPPGPPCPTPSATPATSVGTLSSSTTLPASPSALAAPASASSTTP